MTWLRWASDELHAKWIHVIPNARLLRTLSAYTARHLPLPDAPPGAEGRDGGRGVRVRAAHGPTPTATLATPCGPAPGRDAAPVSEVSRLVSLCQDSAPSDSGCRGRSGEDRGGRGRWPPVRRVLSRARALLRCTFGAFFKAVEAHHLESERIHHVQPMHPPAPPTHTHNSSAVAVQTARADAPRLKSDPRRLGHGPVPSPPYLPLHLHHLHHLRRQSSGGAPQNGSDQNGGVMYP